VNVLIYKGQSTVTANCDAIDNAMRDAFNICLSSCCFSLEEVGEAQRLDNAMEDDEVVYHAQWRYARGYDDAGPLTG